MDTWNFISLRYVPAIHGIITFASSSLRDLEYFSTKRHQTDKVAWYPVIVTEPFTRHRGNAVPQTWDSQSIILH